jgi:3-isopropylmalate/(R)-2-methylmalate dehydratase small subunit
VVIGSVSGRGIVLRGDDIDTDRIIPAKFLTGLAYDKLGDHVFASDREFLRNKGLLHPFDDARFSNACILVVNRNFGCGSSREHAPQALLRFGNGIRAVVGESFGEIFSNNCCSIGMVCCTASRADVFEIMEILDRDHTACISIDLSQELLLIDSEVKYKINMPPPIKSMFLTGSWDPLQQLMSNPEMIQNVAQSLPYFYHWGRSLGD